MPRAPGTRCELTSGEWGHTRRCTEGPLAGSAPGCEGLAPEGRTTAWACKRVSECMHSLRIGIGQHLHQAACTVSTKHAAARGPTDKLATCMANPRISLPCPCRRACRGGLAWSLRELQAGGRFIMPQACCENAKEEFSVSLSRGVQPESRQSAWRSTRCVW